ncbi:MAG: hypothetical protein HZA31_01575 [Opitutae bacterium]|nr:hypothetical protein [Opitutae bacterium]
MNAPSLTIILCALCCIAARPVPEKIESLDQLRKAASESEVAVIDFTIPVSKNEAEEVLAKRYFNTPHVMRFSGVTTTAWNQKWDLMASVLVEKAEKQKLDAKSLRACLKALNRGQTEETMMCPIPPDWDQIPRDETPAAKAKRMREEQARYDAAIKDRKAHPEKWTSPDAAIPIGAYLAKHTSGSCWIIVCVWEDEKSDSDMGHVRVWAMDAVTHKSVAFVTCD